MRSLTSSRSPAVRACAARPFRRDVARVTPRRLAHVLLFTRDVEKAVQFYTRTLGLRLSDRSGEGIAFLHGIHGSDHHMIAFVKSSAPGLHHLSWDVGSVDDIGRGAMHMLDKGFARGWGLGRHVLGSNFFHYVGDPWGSFSEYSAGIDFVPADCDWKSGDHAPEDSFYVWGPNAAGLFHAQCRGVSALPLSPWGSGRGEARTLIRRFTPPSPWGRRDTWPTNRRRSRACRRVTSTSIVAGAPFSLGEKVVGEADRMRARYRQVSHQVPAASVMTVSGAPTLK